MRSAAWGYLRASWVKRRWLPVCLLFGHRVVRGLAGVYAHGTPWPKCGRCRAWLPKGSLHG